MQNKNVGVKTSVILNSFQDLQRGLLSLLNGMRGRCQIKFGMTSLFKHGGFTLIELLVVVLIIGILAAVALPQYKKAVIKSQTVQLFARANALDKAQRAYFLANGTFSNDKTKLDISDTNEATCGIYQGTFFCGLSSTSLPYITFEWQGASATGKTKLVCISKGSKEIGNHICSIYAKNWDGSGNAKEHGNNNNYYHGAWK